MRTAASTLLMRAAAGQGIPAAVLEPLGVAPADLLAARLGIARVLAVLREPPGSEAKGGTSASLAPRPFFSTASGEKGALSATSATILPRLTDGHNSNPVRP